MSLQKQFNEFNDNIKLGREDESYKSAREKDNSITSDIKEAFRDSGWTIKSHFIQGSFATSTAIKSSDNDFDIDRALVIDKSDSESDPVKHKKKILETLENRGFQNAKIKLPCVTADYSSLNLHIDYPLYREDSTNNLELAIGKKSSDEDNRIWEQADPRGLTDWINNDNYATLTQEEIDQFKRLVRYLKRWRNEKYKDSDTKKHIYSIGLTIMIKKGFHPSIDSNGICNDLLALYDTVNEILERQNFFILNGFNNNSYDLKVELPVKPYRDVFHKHGTSVGTNLRNKMVDLRQKLKEAIEEESLIEQCEILRSLFGGDFPVPDKEPTKSKSSIREILPGFVVPNQGA